MSETPTPPKLTHNEIIKDAIPTLAGTIAATLADPAADHFSEDDNQFLKFHGSYQQDDRDLRKTGKKYIMMIRGRIPGGVMTAKQWCVFDELATQYGNNTLRITTRQSIQFHGVVKSGLRPLVAKINESLLSTLAACGDVNRNVMAAPTPAYTKAREQVFADSHKVAMALAPQTKAYHSIWIDGVQLDNEAAENKNFVDPLYGKTYLPRKFKIAFVIPPVNDMDVFTNCLGFIAVVENDQLVGYNLAVGGGMGRSHGNEATYPRLADVIGFFPPDKLVDVAKAVLTIHRDFGDRTDRKHARLKYVVAEKGVKFMQDEVNQRAGITLAPAKPYKFTTTQDLYRLAQGGGWQVVSRAVRQHGPREGRAEDGVAAGRGEVSAHRIPAVGKSKCHPRQRERCRQSRHHRAAHRRRSENGKSSHRAARRFDGLSRRCRPAASASRNPSATCPA